MSADDLGRILWNSLEIAYISLKLSADKMYRACELKDQTYNKTRTLDFLRFGRGEPFKNTGIPSVFVLCKSKNVGLSGIEVHMDNMKWFPVSLFVCFGAPSPPPFPIPLLAMDQTYPRVLPQRPPSGFQIKSNQ